MPENDEIDLTEHRAIIYLPENAVEIEINCKIFNDGELLNVCKVLKMSDIREAFRKADDGYIDEEDRFVLTEKGLKWLEEQKEE